MQPFVDLSSLESVLVLIPKQRSRRQVTLDALKAAVLLFLAVLIQVSVLSAYTPLGGTADLVLVLLISIALLRGSIFGALAGFGAGLLIDTANLGTLGFTSLLLTLAGFWTGRYGETTAQDRFHAPFTSVAVITVLYAFGALALRFVLGQPAPAGVVLAGLPATVLLNLLLTWPVYALRAPRVPAGRRLRPRPRGAAPWLATKRSRRFLPGDPRVEEPYRLTPQLALRVAILGFVALAVFAVLFLRLWALQVLSGDKYRGRGEQQPRPEHPDRRPARHDRRLQRGTVLVTNVLGTSLELWPADLPKTWPARAEGAAGALRGRRRAGEEDPRRDAPVRERPADAGRAPPRDPLRPDLLPQGAPARVPRASSSRTPTSAATRTSRSPRRCSATSGRSAPPELKSGGACRLPAAGRDGPGRDRADLRPLPARPDGSAQLTVDSRGRPTSPVQTKRSRSRATRSG